MSTNPLSLEFNQFFIELAANNHKQWFDENRKRYETVIKKPFEEFTALLINAVNKENPKVNPLPKQCIFRINRDIRFSKDKTPYKLNRSAAININGRKDMSPTGLYVELGPEHVRVYRGIYQLERADIYKVRSYMSRNNNKLQNLIQDKDFEKLFGDINGVKAKRIEKELRESAEKQPLLLNKQWYVYNTMDPSEVTSPNLIDKVMDRYRVADPLSKFLAKALH